MAQLFKNAALSALTAPIGAADTSLTVNITHADLFPAANTGTDPVPTIGKDWFKACIEDVNGNIEVVYVRTRTLGSATMSNLLRAQDGTTAISFAAGSIVELRHTALDLADATNLAAQATTAGKDLLWAADAVAQVKKLGAQLQKQLVTAFTTAGTPTAYTITPDPAVTAYVANLSFDLTFHVACGASPTLAISGLATPPNLVKRAADGSYANLVANDIQDNHRSRVTLISATQAVVERIYSVVGADIVSAATLPLAARTGNLLRVTGVVPVSATDLENGGQVWLIAVGALPFTYHATNMPIEGGSSHTCDPGSLVFMARDGSGVLTVRIHRQDGTLVVSPSKAVAGDLGLLYNGSFEDGTTGWTLSNYTGGSNAISSTNQYDGLKSLELTSTVLANGGCQATSNAYMPVSGGEVRALNFSLQASVANVSSKVEAIWYDKDQAQISVSTLLSHTNTPTSWTRERLGCVAPAAARFMRLRFTGGVPAVGSSTGTVRFDGISLIAAGSGLLKVLSGSAASVSTLEMIWTDFAAYKHKRLMLDSAIPVDDGVSLLIRTSTNAGSSYDSGASDYTFVLDLMEAGGSTTVVSSTAGSSMQVSGAVGTDVGESTDLSIDFFNTNDATKYTRCSYLGHLIGATGVMFNFRGSAGRRAAQDTDAIQLRFVTGNIESISYSLYVWN